MSAKETKHQKTEQRTDRSPFSAKSELFFGRSGRCSCFSAAKTSTPRANRSSTRGHLSTSYDAVNKSDAPHAAERSSAKIDQTKCSDQTVPAVDCNELANFDVVPVSAGSNIDVFGPKPATTVGAGPSPPPKGTRLAKAVVEAVCKLAMQSHCPGV